MTHRRALALPLLAAWLATPALAQDRPEIFPTRDVAVTYRATSEGQTAELRMAWSAAQRLMRMDMPGGQGAMIVNQQTGAGFMVMPQMRMIMDMPADQAGAAARFTQASETARFTRDGSDRVANLPCTLWRVEDRGETARICTTADGVTLRASGGGAVGRGTLEALTVDYAAQDGARFARPQGYQNMQIPGAAQGGSQGGAPAAGAGGNFPGRGTALPPPGIAAPGITAPGSVPR